MIFFGLIKFFSVYYLVKYLLTVCAWLVVEKDVSHFSAVTKDN